MPPKRKRAPTLPSQAAEPENAQPSAGNASDEDTEPALESVKSKKEQSASINPPAKRTRSTRAEKNGDVGKEDADMQDEDGDVAGGGENGEAEKMKMDKPGKGGLVDPVGYHTNPPPKGRPVRVYADGVFDLFHLGHMRQLEQAKTAFPEVHLMVGVTGDRETHRRKGLTVLSGKERAETVRHCKWVDEVIEDCPWIVTVDFIEKHKIDYIAHDDLPYGADEGDDIYKPIKEKGMFLVTQRTEGVSTTGIITKIVRDYEQYIARQLKRGTTRQELNISWLKKNELDIKRHVAEIRDTIRTNWTTTGQELGKEFRQFWQPSRPGSPAPSMMGRRSRRSDATFETPKRGGETSPSGLSHLSIPASVRREGGGRDRDFVAGYTMGLLGGVRGWMQKNRHSLSGSSPPSDGSDEDVSGAKSPSLDEERGRKRKSEQEEIDAQMSTEMH